MAELEDFTEYFEAVKKYIVEKFEDNLKNTEDQGFLIKTELQQIEQFEQSVESIKGLYSTNFLTEYRMFSEQPNGVMLPLKHHQYEFEYLRVKCGYYGENPNRKMNPNTAFVIANYIYFKEYLLQRQTQNRSESSLVTPNPHPNIFVSVIAFELFKEWYEIHFNEKRNHMANFSFIIRIMQKDKLILGITQAELKQFLSEMNVHLDKIKTLLASETKGKKELYKELKKKAGI